MRDFPSCFGESSVQIAADAASSSSSSHSPSSLAHRSVTSLYRARLGGSACVVTVTWSKSLVGPPSLSLSLSDALLRRPLCSPLHIKPSLFSSRNKGSRPLLLLPSLQLLYDLSSATFSASSPEPLSGFYVALVLDLKPILLLGDLPLPLCRFAALPPASAPLLARREHLIGKKLYSTTAHLAGNRREVSVECDAAAGEPALDISVDRRRVLQVRRLRWKFRGNQSIVVDGATVEVFWDVHGWLFGGSPANAVFVFAESPSEDDGFSLVLYAWRE